MHTSKPFIFILKTLCPLKLQYSSVSVKQWSKPDCQEGLRKGFTARKAILLEGSWDIAMKKRKVNSFCACS